jgi:hypothetical protein
MKFTLIPTIALTIWTTFIVIFAIAQVRDIHKALRKGVAGTMSKQIIRKKEPMNFWFTIIVNIIVVCLLLCSPVILVLLYYNRT